MILADGCSPSFYKFYETSFFFCVLTNKAVTLLEHVLCGSTLPLRWHQPQPLITWCVTAVCLPICQLWQVHIMGAICEFAQRLQHLCHS